MYGVGKMAFLPPGGCTTPVQAMTCITETLQFWHKWELWLAQSKRCVCRVALKCPLSAAVSPLLLLLLPHRTQSTTNAASPLWLSPDLLRRRWAPIHKGYRFRQRASMPENLRCAPPLLAVWETADCNLTGTCYLQRSKHRARFRFGGGVWGWAPWKWKARM